MELYPIELRRTPSELAAARALLSDDEHERAGRFRFERHRRRFIVRRAALRTILAQRLDCDPHELRFVAGPSGKPQLDRAFGDLRPYFSVSSSDELALCAVGEDREIGIDIERLRPVRAWAELATRYFSATEVAALHEAVEDPEQAFLTCWTRKEAFIKALGTGLSHPLRRFSVSLDPGDGARVLDVDGDAAEAGRWWLADLSAPLEGFVAALATRAGRSEVSWSADPLAGSAQR